VAGNKKCQILIVKNVDLLKAPILLVFLATSRVPYPQPPHFCSS